MKLGDMLRSFRQAKGMTQKELANKLSISASAIGMYEQNRRVPDIETLGKFSSIFNVTVDDLLGSNKIVETDVKIHVDTTELDEAIEKANQLLEILKKISIVADSHIG